MTFRPGWPRLPGIPARVRAMQEFLIRLLRRADVDRCPAVDLAVREIELSRGGVRIHELSDRVGWTRRHLDREFSEHVGLSPKAFATIVRFQHLYARGLVSGDWPRSLEELYESYYDQAHFIRQFKHFTGFAPGEFRARQDLPFPSQCPIFTIRVRCRLTHLS